MVGGGGIVGLDGGLVGGEVGSLVFFGGIVGIGVGTN